MDYRSLFEKTVVELRTLARERGVRLPAGTNKARMIELLLASDEARPAGQPAPQAAAQPAQEAAPQPAPKADPAKEEPIKAARVPKQPDKKPSEKAEAADAKAADKP